MMQVVVMQLGQPIPNLAAMQAQDVVMQDPNSLQPIPATGPGGAAGKKFFPKKFGGVCMLFSILYC